MKYKDYYKTLGVKREASKDDIRKAYRRLARKYHPDVSSESQAEERFKEVGEAYEVLKDPEKRRIYDQLGAYQPGQDFRPPPDWASQFGQARGTADFESVDLGDLFENLFGMGAGPKRGGRQYGFRGGGADYEAAVTVTLEEAARGVEKVLHFAGAGGSAREVKVRIPKGVTDGKKLRVPGKGGAASDGGHVGDLYLQVRIQPHPLFRSSGHDLYLDVPLAPWEAALGAEIEIPTLDRSLRLTIKPGAKSGQKLRLKGKGLPKPGGGAGDLMAILQIAVPGSLSKDERALFEKLRESSRFNPRQGFQKGG